MNETASPTAPVRLRRRWRLRHQLLALVLLAVAPLLGVQAYLLYRGAADDLESARETQVARAQRTAAVVRNFLQDTQHALKMLAERPLVRAAGTGRCDPALADFLSLHPGYANIAVVDGAGLIHCSVVPPPGGKPVSAAGAPWFARTMRENKPVASDAVSGPIAAKWVSVLTWPLRGADGAITGMLTLPIDLVEFGSLVVGQGLPPGGIVLMVDSKEVILARSSEAQKWVGASSSALPMVAATRGVEQGVVTGTGIDGIERIHGFATVAGFGWKVWSGVPTTLVYGPIYGRIALATGVSLLILLAAAAATLVIGRRIEAPVRLLAATASMVAGGQRQARATITGAAEMAVVATEFNVMLDAVEHAHAEQREAQHRYQDMLDSVELLALILDTEGRITYCNDFLLRRTGWTREEVLGRDWHTLFLPPELGGDRARFMRNLGNEAITRNAESEIRTRAGERRLINWNNSMLRSPTGAIIGTASIGEDITERRQAGEQQRLLLLEANRSRAALLNLLEDQQGVTRTLRKSEARLAAAQRKARIGSFEMNLDTQALTWSAEMFRIVGLDPALGPPSFTEFVAMIHPGERESYQRSRAAALAERRSHGFEFRVIRTDGSVCWIEGRGEMTFDEAGQPLGTVGTGQDITEHKETEQRLAESHEHLRSLAARLQTVREEQSAHIAREIHDVLGQQLTALKLDLAWLKRRAGAVSDGALAAALTDKLLATSQLVDGMIETVQKIASDLRPGLLDKLGLAAALEHEARDFAERAGLRCACELSAEALDLDDSAAIGVFRIFQETLTNIARHAQASEVQVRLARDAAGLVLEVRDNGRGIAEEQAAGAKSLGLLGMSERARLLGGRLDIKGVPGAGTTVTLTLPAPPP